MTPPRPLLSLPILPSLRRFLPHALGALAWAACVLVAGPSAAEVTSTSYFGGDATDEVVAVVIDDEGALYLAGTSDSATLAGLEGTRLEEGTGFVAKLSPSADQVMWLARLGAVLDMKAAAGGELLLLQESRVAALQADGAALAWQGPDLGTTEAFDVGPEGRIAVLAGDAIVFDADGTTEIWRKDVGRAHPAAIAIDPLTGDVFVSGDTNTNTGQEPWRSPFLFRYPKDGGDRLLELYDWPGPAVREDGRTLQADSFVTHLAFEADGQLWIGAGSDGGNTVLRKEPDDLDTDQDALSGACFDGPCFGYKGAKKTGMFARMNPGLDDMEAASWVIPYLGMPAGTRQDPPCGCKGGNFEGGSGVNPGSFGVQDIAPLGDEVVLLGNPWGKAPATAGGWFPDAVYTGGGIGWMGVFDSTLSSISQAAMIPGSKSAYGAFRGGRLVVVGRAQSNDPPSDPAEEGWLTNLPTDSASLQETYGGGDSDGYLLIACMTTEEECGAPPTVIDDPSDPPGPGTDPATGGTDGTTSSPDTPGDGGAGDGTPGVDGGSVSGDGGSDGDASSGDDVGCGCRASGSTRTSKLGLVLSLGLLLILALRRRRQLV